MWGKEGEFELKKRRAMGGHICREEIGSGKWQQQFGKSNKWGGRGDNWTDEAGHERALASSIMSRRNWPPEGPFAPGGGSVYLGGSNARPACFVFGVQSLGQTTRPRPPFALSGPVGPAAAAATLRRRRREKWETG